MPRAKYLRALASFAAVVGKQEYLIHTGDVLPSNHPVVKGREDLFEPENPVEQATAAPGEKRKR
jgi:hypothetical protein